MEDGHTHGCTDNMEQLTVCGGINMVLTLIFTLIRADTNKFQAIERKDAKRKDEKMPGSKKKKKKKKKKEIMSCEITPSVKRKITPDEKTLIEKT